VNVLAELGRPAHLLGHSKGGGVSMDAALRAPELIRQFVNIGGFGPPPEGFEIPGVAVDPRPIPTRFAEFLDSRRAAANGNGRAYRTFEDLVDRRRAQNPRLSPEWLRYFIFNGARETPAGWVWKADRGAARGS